jgi:hypothetical protein
MGRRLPMLIIVNGVRHCLRTKLHDTDWRECKVTSDGLTVAERWFWAGTRPPWTVRAVLWFRKSELLTNVLLFSCSVIGEPRAVATRNALLPPEQVAKWWAGVPEQGCPNAGHIHLRKSFWNIKDGPTSNLFDYSPLASVTSGLFHAQKCATVGKIIPCRRYCAV